MLNSLQLVDQDRRSGSTPPVGRGPLSVFDSWNGALNYPPMLLERSSLILAAGVFIDDFVERYKAITTGTRSICTHPVRSSTSRLALPPAGPTTSNSERR